MKRSKRRGSAIRCDHRPDESASRCCGFWMNYSRPARAAIGSRNCAPRISSPRRSIRCSRPRTIRMCWPMAMSPKWTTQSQREKAESPRHALEVLRDAGPDRRRTPDLLGADNDAVFSPVSVTVRIGSRISGTSKTFKPVRGSHCVHRMFRHCRERKFPRPCQTKYSSGSRALSLSRRFWLRFPTSPRRGRCRTSKSSRFAHPGQRPPTRRREALRGSLYHSPIPLALAAHPDVDLVTVSVKVPDHYKPVMAAIDAGKHVYCEWPLRPRHRRSHEMRDAAEAKQASATPSGCKAVSALDQST